MSLTVGITDALALVTLDRPDVRNAIDRKTADQLIALAADLDADPSVEVIAITGTDPAFCSGVDRRDIRQPGEPRPPVNPVEAWLQIRKPVIGAINGPCVTGGLELALSCDFLIASERARFGDTHARIGLLASWGLTALLPEAIGTRRAKEMSITGRLIDADTAYSWSLVNRVVAHESLLDEVRRTASNIMLAAPTSVIEFLRLYDVGAGASRAERLDHERSARTSFVRPGPRRTPG